ncbi:SbcC/MukB-like Walker B domain-containing protein [Companilactobacillus kimchiensis]|uniref:Nuclease SbcCD subunit C n=1 Tax=Companilactobacillus kimchiensis TaxID=993692 RepID=A0A0R2LAA1_9LACO|nr:SMC family ATPase [Companilactobacillus kimchiensis]KRN98728.1 exonuclease SbcC [Companilactobacillus kimchiensis]
MKPIYLEMNNFGPHEHSIIDFRKLDESPIFLIGGDTGAGKSTIFDAMTFALFSSTTSDRDAKEMRSQFAEPKDATNVIFYFEQSGKIYKIERTPEQFLAKKSGTGTTKKIPTADLSVVEDVGGIEIESIATKPVDVGHAITEILNLNADQFKKIILLPQNDFSEFLKSNTTDKEKILKKIFGTQLFTDFTTQLKVHYDEANAKSTNFNSNLKSQTESTIWTDDEQVKMAATPNDQLVTVITDYLKQRQDKLTAADEAQKIADGAWKKSDKNYHAAQELQKQFDNLAESKQNYQTNIVEKATDIKDKQTHVAELTWAQPLRETVRDLDRTKAEQAETTKNEQKISAELKNSEAKLKQDQTNLNTLTSQIDTFEDKNKQAQKLTVLITKAQDVEKIQIELQGLKPQLTKAEAAVKKQTTNLETLKQQITTKSSDAISTDNLTAQKDSLVKEKDNLIDTLQPLENNRNTTVADVQQLQKRLDSLTADLKIKQTKLTDAKTDYQAKIQTRQELMIAQLRQELTENKACPVCGSLDHPFAHNEATADETELRKSMDEVDNSQKTYAAADNAVKTLQENLDTLSAEFSEKQQTAVAALRELSSKYTELYDQVSIKLPLAFDLNIIKNNYQVKIDDLDQQIKNAQKLAKEIKNLEQQQAKAQEILNQATSQFDKLSTQYQTRTNDYQTKLKSLDNPDISSQELIEQQNELSKAYTDFQKSLKTAQNILNDAEKKFSNTQIRLTDIQATLKNQTEAVKTLSETLTKALTADDAKTNDYDVLDNWILELSQNKLTGLQNTIASYNKEKELLKAAIEKVQIELIDIKQPDLPALKQINNNNEAKRTAAIQISATAEKDFSNAQASFEKVKNIMQQQGAFAKELAAITSLYNIVNGKDGNDSKLKLETYVVQNYLQRILVYANMTFLNRLSHNRYQFVLSKESSNKQRDRGLDINIYDRETDSVRSSNTLSGGETFIAALSIALSLSEVVQSSANGVQIDALFVDEGFGSLDDETLKSAMEALEEIGKNRMVGVISHIESMKQSIGQQLLVKKTGNGKSTIELISK